LFCSNRLQELIEGAFSFYYGYSFLLRLLCQCFATALANFCHRIGKTLPPHWQDFAIALARLCHRIGKTLAKEADLYRQAVSIY